MRRWIGLGSLVCWMAAGHADVVEWNAHPSVDVRFMGYEDGLFLFQDNRRQTQHTPAEHVDRLRLSEVLSVAVGLHGGRRELTAELYAYEKEHFVLRVDGRLLRIPRALVAGLTLGLRSERMRALAEVAILLDGDQGETLPHLLQTERPAIVLFHHPERPHSVRMDGYLGRFPVMSRGHIEYYKAELRDRYAPLAVSNRVTTFPTILFYNVDRNESARLEGAVTTREIDEAVRRIAP